MWAEYAGEDENKDGVCIVMTVRQLVICAAARGGRVYQIHYLNEDGNLGTGDIHSISQMTKSESSLISHMR